MKNLIKFISYYSIQHGISELAYKMNEEYANVTKDDPLCLIVVAQGAIRFYVDLSSQLSIPNIFGLVQTSGDWNKPHDRSIKFLDITPEKIKGRNVVIVEDIVDSGNTVKLIKEKLLDFAEPRTLKVASLLVNNTNPNLKEYPDYHLFNTEGRYVFGYGLDSHDGLDRNLNSIYYTEDISVEK